MSRTDQSTTTLLEYRERVLSTGEWPADQTLRPEIADSWRRCMMSGVTPELLATAEETINDDGLLYRTARGVVSRRGEQLAGTSTGLILADRNGVVIDRWTDDDALGAMLDASRSDRGALLEESVAGTNGVGTVLELLKPIQIRGAEHFTDAFREFSCVGVPIRHPITRRLQGVLNITCRYEDTNSLLMPLALDTAREIEQQIYLGSSRAERLMLDHFLATERRTSGPLIAITDQLVITNPAAARILDDLGQAALWEIAAHAIGGRCSQTKALSMRSGQVLTANCDPVEDGNAMVGAIITIQSPRAPCTSRQLSVGVPALNEVPEHLPGRTAAWRHTWLELSRLRHLNLPFLVTGEAGTGKSALIGTAFGDEASSGRLVIVDASLEPIDGTTAWTHAVRAVMSQPDRILVIEHIDALSEPAARALCGLLDAAGDRGARAIGTRTTSDGADAAHAHAPLVDRLSVATVVVPPLRYRLDDIPDILAELTRRHSTRDPKPRWLPDAVQALSRVSWASNVRELENVVRRVVAVHGSGDIRADDLPDSIRGQSSRPWLSPLERLECDAIVVAVKRAKGNKSVAADLLGISRATLYRKIRSFGLDLTSKTF